MRIAKITTLLLLAALVVPAIASADECKGTIYVTIENYSSFEKRVVVVDKINGSTRLNENMKPWAKKAIPICSNGTHDSGYGHVKYKSGGGSWVNSSLLRDGDDVCLDELLASGRPLVVHFYRGRW